MKVKVPLTFDAPTSRQIATTSIIPPNTATTAPMATIAGTCTDQNVALDLKSFAEISKHQNFCFFVFLSCI
jgi:hypothetical protein